MFKMFEVCCMYLDGSREKPENAISRPKDHQIMSARVVVIQWLK